MLRITARYADQWNTWATPEQAAAPRAALLEACDAVGRDPATIWKSVNALVELDASTPPPGRAVLFGSGPGGTRRPDRAVRRVSGYDELPSCPSWNLGTDKTEIADNVARIKTQVLDQV